MISKCTVRIWKSLSMFCLQRPVMVSQKISGCFLATTLQFLSVPSLPERHRGQWVVYRCFVSLDIPRSRPRSEGVPHLHAVLHCLWCRCTFTFIVCINRITLMSPVRSLTICVPSDVQIVLSLFLFYASIALAWQAHSCTTLPERRCASNSDGITIVSDVERIANKSGETEIQFLVWVWGWFTEICDWSVRAG